MRRKGKKYGSTIKCFFDVCRRGRFDLSDRQDFSVAAENDLKTRVEQPCGRSGDPADQRSRGSLWADDPAEFFERGDRRRPGAAGGRAAADPALPVKLDGTAGMQEKSCCITLDPNRGLSRKKASSSRKTERSQLARSKMTARKKSKTHEECRSL